MTCSGATESVYDLPNVQGIESLAERSDKPFLPSVPDAPAQGFQKTEGFRDVLEAIRSYVLLSNP